MLQILPIKQALNLFHIKPMVVVSDSMTGIFEVGDVIFIKSTNLDELQTGDIISFYQDLNGDSQAEVVTHTLVQINNENNVISYKTKSNYSERWDNWTLSQEDIIGQYTFRIPFIGHLTLLLKNPLVLGIIISLLLIFKAISLLVKNKHQDAS